MTTNDTEPINLDLSHRKLLAAAGIAGAAPWRFLSRPFARPGPGPAHQLNAKIRQLHNLTTIAALIGHEKLTGAGCTVRLPKRRPSARRGAACKAGLPRGVVLMDAGYGCNTDLRTSVSALGLTYVAGIFSHTTVWTCDTRPLPPKKWSGRGRPTKRLRCDRKHQPIAVKELALNLPKRAWRTIKGG